MLNLQNPAAFRHALEQHALVLTPNHQLAVALHESHGQLCAALGKPLVQATAPIMAVDIWLRHIWASLAQSSPEQAVLLEPAYETFLWQHIIRHSSAGAALLNPGAAAAAASEAWTLMQHHELDQKGFAEWLANTGSDRDDYPDIQVFLSWSQRFEQHLLENNYQTLSQCLERVVRGLEAADPALLAQLPPHSFQFGFEDPPPLYRRLLEQLAHHTEHDMLELHRAKAKVRGWQCNSQLQEITLAAQWCQKILQQDASAHIAILIPDMQGLRTTLERVFQHYVDPNAVSMPAARQLDKLPLIVSALQLLRLNTESLDVLSVCQTLRSPFLPQEDSSQARAALEKHLRNEGERFLSSARLRSLCLQEDRDWHCPALAARLSVFHESARRQSAQPLTGADAVSLILRQLEAMGWPGEGWSRDDSRVTRQAFESWESLLDQLTELCSLLGPLVYQEIIQLLQQLAASTPAPRQRFGQIRLMTPAEAQFLQFSHVWFMGLDDKQWPGAPRLNPFLPLPLQREYGIAAEDQTAHMRWHEQLVLGHIAQQCEYLELSFASLEAGHDQSPSAVFQALLSSQPVDEPVNLGDTAEHALHPEIEAQRERMSADLIQEGSEAALFPLQPTENPRGGSAIIENQSCCPFRSFALHRLAADELRDPEYGLNPMATGTMLHAAMDHLWGQIPHYAQLMALSSEQVDTQIREACEEALRQTALGHPVLMQGRFRQLELERLQSLLKDWLEQERLRPFSKIIAREQALTWQYGELEIRLRLDRVEERQDGTLAIIDYKSGRKKTIKWTDPRPETPQLMLYCLAASAYYSEREISALLFAHINAHEQVFNGLSLDSEAYPSIDFERQLGQKTGLSWEALRQQWQSSMESLADQFVAGECQVTPRNAAICQRCHLQAFCRIGDHARLVGSPDSTAEDAS